MSQHIRSFVEPADVEGGTTLKLGIHEHLISQPLAVLGVRYAGKSYLVGKILEGLCEAKQPFILIDRQGEHWTLRERYPVLVATVGKPSGRPKGYRADLALSPVSAGALASRVVEKGYSLVLDLKNATMTEVYGTLGPFLETIYIAESRYNHPIVLVMEEAQVLVPEVGRVRLRELKKLQEKVVYWTYEIVAGGRHRGLGFILVARRAAEVAKAVLSQCPARIIFRMVDPADFSWLRQSGLTSKQIIRVQKLPQGSALVIGMNSSPCFVKVKPRVCAHGGSTPITKAVETPELSEAVKDLDTFIKAPLMPDAETPRKKMSEASIKQLKDRTRRLLEKATKVLKTTENIASCTHAEGKRDEHVGENLEQSRNLNSDISALSVEGELQDKLKAFLKDNGKSFTEWVKEQLEIEEAKETTIEKAYKEGYNKGYEEAKKKHLVTYPCSVCGKPIEITDPKTKDAVAKYMGEYGWGHVACHEMRNKG